VDVAHKFTGKELDAETGLYFYEARYYDPALARFITPDTVIARPGDPQEFNRYTYARNNPLKYTDPTGHKSWWKKLWEKIKKPLISAAIVVATALAPWGAGLTAGTWIAAGSAAATTAAFDTGEGRQLIKRVGKEFFDDVLGMSPKAAYIASSVILPAVTATAMEHVIGSMVAAKGSVSRPKSMKPGTEPLPGQGTGYGGSVAEAAPKDRFVLSASRTGTHVADFVMRPVEVPVFEQFGFLHMSATFADQWTKTTAVGSMGWTWGWSSYVCHQAYAVEMLNRGYFATAITTAPLNYTTYVSSVMLGTYGGRLYNNLATGLQAAERYEGEGQ
jgi:RHS repeat-associated protein